MDGDHPTIVDQFKQRGPRLCWKWPPEWNFSSVNLRVSADRVVLMMVHRNPETSQFTTRDKLADEQNSPLALGEDETRVPPNKPKKARGHLDGLQQLS